MRAMQYKVKEYKDGQVTAKVLQSGDLEVKIQGNSYSDLFKAASIKEAWDSNPKANKSSFSSLSIACLIGQRSDRRFGENESFDLKVIANFINSMGYDEVNIFHPHSDVAIALIDNSVRLSHVEYVKQAYEAEGKPILVSPDAGAYKSTKVLADEFGADLIPSNKVRVDGIPSISFQGDVKGKNCLIVDDLADGGRTFKQLGTVLKEQGAIRVVLYVSHGQFNFGFDELKESLDHIYCTNSFKMIENDFVTQFDII